MDTQHNNEWVVVVGGDVSPENFSYTEKLGGKKFGRSEVKEIKEKRMKLEKSLGAVRWLGMGLFIATGLLFGCSGRPEVTNSGFLGDYSQLKPHPNIEQAMIYENPAKSLKGYNKFIVDPVLVHFAPNAEGTAIDPEDLKELTDYFHASVVKALMEKKQYEVVDAPGPEVARLRIAITGIKKAIPMLNIEPRLKMIGAGLGGAAMEGEAIDSQSKARLAAVVDSESGSRMGVTAGLSSLGYAKEVMDGWSKRFVAYLDKLHGYTN